MSSMLRLAVAAPVGAAVAISLFVFTSYVIEQAPRADDPAPALVSSTDIKAVDHTLEQDATLVESAVPLPSPPPIVISDITAEELATTPAEKAPEENAN